MARKKETEKLKEEIEGMVSKLVEGELTPEQRKAAIKQRLDELEFLGFPIKLGTQQLAIQPVEVQAEDAEEEPETDLPEQKMNSSLDRAHNVMKIRYDPMLRKQHTRLAPEMILPMAANLAISEYDNSDKKTSLELMFLWTFLDLLNSYKGEGLKGLQGLAGVVTRGEESGGGDWARGI